VPDLGCVIVGSGGRWFYSPRRNGRTARSLTHSRDRRQRFTGPQLPSDRQPQLWTIVRLARGLNVAPADLLDGIR
jgi:hypothetical protein